MSGERPLGEIEEVDRAFAEHVHHIGEAREDGREWYFGDALALHTKERARQIVRACIILGVPVTDIVTADAWLRIIERVADLEEAVRELRRRDT